MINRLQSLLSNKWSPAIVGAVLMPAGFVAGYFVGKKVGVDNLLDQVAEAYRSDGDPHVDSNQMTFDEYQAAQKIQDELARKLNSQEEDEVVSVVHENPDGSLRIVEFVQDPEETLVAKDYMDATTIINNYVNRDELEGYKLVVDEPSPANLRANIFSGIDGNWDTDAEMAAREALSEGEPYILHKDEFDLNESEYRQTTVTYYKGDDVLADELDNPMYAYNTTFGELNFGHGSGDPNVVYIRNDHLKMEWEVILHNGRFDVEVQGQNIQDEFEESDLRHSNDRKFRLKVD